MYHTVVYSLYAPSTFNNIPILVIIVTHDFLPNDCHGNLNHVTCQQCHCGSEYQVWCRLALHQQNYSYKLLHSVIVSIKQYCCLNILVYLYNITLCHHGFAIEKRGLYGGCLMGECSNKYGCIFLRLLLSEVKACYCNCSLAFKI